MKRFLVYTILLVLLAGCNKSKPRPKPDYVLSPDSMALLLAEVHVLNSASQHREARRQHFQKFIEAEQSVLFDSLGVPRARFDSSLTFWLQDPERMLEIYDQSMNILSTKLAKVKQPAQDSIAPHEGNESIKKLLEKDGNLMKLK